MWLNMQKLWIDSSLLAVLSVLVVVVISAAAIWLLLKWRESTKNAFDSVQSCLKEFEEMRLEGDITDEEYRKIKASARKIAASSGPKANLDQPSNGTSELPS